jgi:predicted nucleic acid-binding protein
MTNDRKTKFNNFLKRSNMHLIATTLPIAQKARQVRDRGLDEGRKIKTPDATIIATAIIQGCDCLHSLDDKGNGPLKLNGSKIVDGLRITKPIPFSGQDGIA